VPPASWAAVVEEVEVEVEVEVAVAAV